MRKITRKDKLLLYRTMVLIRKTEERILEIFGMGKIPGFIHVSIGQEAAAAAVVWHMNKQDKLSTTHRGHGHALARGLDLNRFMAEIFGKKEGYCRGRSGSMHMADKDLGLLGANGIVGAGIPIAAGAAFASKYKRDNGVTVCFFGEGATSEGAFHETLNLAAVLKLPIIFVCENNRWAQFTSHNRQMMVEDVSSRAKAYNIMGQKVNNEVLEIYRVAGKAFERVRKGEGPFLLEIKSHRWYGHYAGDNQKYRPSEDIHAARQKDCIADFEGGLKEEGILDHKTIEKIGNETDKEIDDAVAYAEHCTDPDVQDLTSDVYAL